MIMEHNLKSKIKIKKLSELPLFDKEMLQWALEEKNKSVAEKRKTGAVIANSNLEIIYSFGHNKLPDNCSDMVFEYYCETNNKIETNPNVIHAEELAVKNYLIDGNKDIDDQKNLTMYCTFSPCSGCSNDIISAGIKRLLFIELHEENFINIEFAPIKILLRNNIEIIQVLWDQ